jgi:GT2 family glycosyltransferase
VYVGNEIPSDLVRWLGPRRVLDVLERLIRVGRDVAPGVLFGYANYPGTEYLEPANADFSAFNIYLEDEAAYRSHLVRLHHVAGDRPLLVSEFGMDSLRNGRECQAGVLAWALRGADDAGVAGFTIYSWSDRWWNGGREVLDWDFGLNDRAGREKPALRAVSAVLAEEPAAGLACAGPRFSVIVCTRNGGRRIAACLRAVLAQRGAEYEVIVVDDGSTDDTAAVVAQGFPSVRLERTGARGLGEARNRGAELATGEVLAFTDDDCEPDVAWLAGLARVFRSGCFAAVGGPNLAPVSRTWREAVVAAAEGAPSQVLIDDREADHLPGCNLAVVREAFHAVGGFDPDFHTAGDDVDFCWRLRAAGYRLGFSPLAFVWHHRRGDLRGFVRQQIGYGRAERVLIRKHPARFSDAGDAMWEGFVYGGGPLRVGEQTIVHHGRMGMAPYQSAVCHMMPRRGLDWRHDHAVARTVLGVVDRFVPWLRKWVRRGGVLPPGFLPRVVGVRCRLLVEEGVCVGSRSGWIGRLLAEGWEPGSATDRWDLVKQGVRVGFADTWRPGRVLYRVEGCDGRLLSEVWRRLEGGIE